MNNPKYIIVHCSDVSYKTSSDQYASINKYHKDERGFPVSKSGQYVGYHSLITGGKNWRPRQDDEMGAHCNQEYDGVNIFPTGTGKAQTMNLQSLGVCVGFDGDVELPTQADAVMLRDQIWAWQDKYGIATKDVRFHRDFATGKTCPGSLVTRAWLEQLIKRVPKTPMAELTVDKSMVIWLIDFLRRCGIITAYGSINNNNQNMQTSLIMLRVKSIAWNLASLVGTTIVAALLSDDFVAKLLTFVQQNAGVSFWGTLLAFAIPEVVKHIRNKVVLGRASKIFGSTRARQEVTLL